MKRSILAGLAAVLLALAPTRATSQTADEILRAWTWRSIGPANMMGRIAAVDGWNDDWRVFLVGAASGGVWKTTNGGTTFTPIFDRYGSQSIGDVALFQADTSVVWVGTGEATNRNSVGWGDGVYRSDDGGRTFTNVGLGDTFQISEIALHPSDPDVAYVAALGHLFGYTGDRGLFRTEDGGQTWAKLAGGLPQSARLGATVVAVDPLNPEIVYAGLYDRLRQPHHMQSGGPGGGLFKSEDDGRTWRKLTAGLPTGITGQIDIDIHEADPRILVAFIETDEDVPEGRPGSGVYRSDDAGETWRFVHRNFSRPTYHGRVRIDPSDSSRIYVVSRAFAWSNDGGKTFEDGQPWRVDGGDDHDLWISPRDSRVILMATDQGARITLDRGRSAFMLNNMAIGQFYAIGTDMRDPYWVYGGLQDNGGWAIPSNSRDGRGILVDHAWEVNGGDGFHMQVDPADWRTLYTAVHVGYFGRMNVATGERKLITPTPASIVNFTDVYDPDLDELPVDYTINPGNYWVGWPGPSGDMNGAVLPPQFRFNWNSPLVLSSTIPGTVYVAGNYLLRSKDRGETWHIISPDLTLNLPGSRNSTESGGLTKDVTGAENHHTIYTIDESPLDPNVVWTGSDDGVVGLTRDGGATWSRFDRFPGVPGGLWISRVEASNHSPGRVWVTIDGHWKGDVLPYVVRSDDFGASWTNVTANLPATGPAGSVYTVVESSRNADLLFVGTEFGCFVTMDGARSWHPFMNDLPPVAVHDLVLHPRERDLVAGTHGRSIWIADDLSALEQLSDSVRRAALSLLPSRPGTHWTSRGKGRVQTDFLFRGENPPGGAAVRFWLADTPSDSTARLEVTDPLSGIVVHRSTHSVTAGMNVARWTMRKDYVDPETLDAARTDHMARVAEVASRLAAFEDSRVLFHLARDLRAPHRSPGLFDDEYPESADDREFLQAHLGFIRSRVEQAESARDLNAARSALMTFSTLVGDEAYFGFFGDEIARPAAMPGKYRIRVTAGDHSAEGMVEVRDDPSPGTFGSN